MFYSRTLIKDTPNKGHNENVWDKTAFQNDRLQLSESMLAMGMNG